MNYKLKIVGVGVGVIIIFLLCVLIFTQISQQKTYTKTLKTTFEYAYSEGQKDIITNKNIAIKYDSENFVWYWIGSPWDSGKKPIYNLNDDIINQLSSLSFFQKERQLILAFEYSYSEGQKDMLTGENITIEYDSNNKVWCWIGSPWDNGEKPIYNLNENIENQIK